ncbi:MAG TPA: SH3 domain-containing protein [Steroidobacteraceae bacterium]|nr:SH3 domain-containing protein [Steroidobacteraceae bacterium]
MSRRRRTPLASAALPAVTLAMALAAAAAHGDALYVIEQVVVNVNSAPDASGERIATVKSGERVEELERVRDQVHVRLADGKDGWIRASYLSADEPLRARLAQRDQQLAQLEQDVSRLQAQLAAAHGAAPPASPTSGAAPATPAAPAAATSASAASSAPPTATASSAAEDPGGGAPMFASGDEENAYHVWPWTLAAALLGLGVGFALGVLVLDRHIRRKYGGLRIY